jgi:hypothetical protein
MQEIKALFRLALVGCVLSTSLCGIASGSSYDGSDRKIIHAFFQMPLKDRLAHFTTYSIREQYAIYIYGNQKLEPPAMYLARPFGAEGAKVVPLLRARLAAASDDATIRDIVLVFSEMSSQGAVRVAQDQKLMKLLTDSVAKMKDPGWRSISEHELEKIRTSA